MPGLTGRVLPSFLPSSFSGQGRLQSLLFSGLQVKGVLFGIPDDVFLLHLPLKAAQGALQGFAIVYDYICQVSSPFHSGPYGRKHRNRIRESLLTCQGRGLTLRGFVRWVVQLAGIGALRRLPHSGEPLTERPLQRPCCGRTQCAPTKGCKIVPNWNVKRGTWNVERADRRSAPNT